ncbi:NUDIX hydrolase [bacterium]|nr:NUDIX hydrolase [candidate division CSSED10-310 bacterium]
MSREYDGYFKIDRAVIRMPRLDKSGERTITRYVFERGDAAAILLHDFQHRSLLLVRQYRHPAAVRGETGWLYEIIAGSIKQGENRVEVIRREVLEESGITIGSIRPMGMFFLSPGGSSERCFLYEASVDTRGMQGRICGEAGSDEDVFVEIMTLDVAARMIRDGRIADAKTIIAVQHLLMGNVESWGK